MDKNKGVINMAFDMPSEKLATIQKVLDLAVAKVPDTEIAKRTGMHLSKVISIRLFFNVSGRSVINLFEEAKSMNNNTVHFGLGSLKSKLDLDPTAKWKYKAIASDNKKNTVTLQFIEG